MITFNDDFRNIIQTVKFDVIISDPPYNIDFKYPGYSDNLKQQEYIDLIAYFKGMKTVLIHYPEETMRYFVPALGVPDDCVVWCYNSNLPRQSRLINFFGLKPDYTKVKQPYKNPNDKRIKKLIEEGSEGTRSYDWFSDIQLVKNVSKEKSHACPVPIKLMERIILLCTNPGDIVFDPFMGSGTTGIACKNTGREFVGCEIDEVYYDMACGRLDKGWGECTGDPLRLMY